MKPTTKKSTAKLNAAIAPAIRNFKPPEDLTVAEWADRHRRLSPENSAESGPWRTSRTPYLREPMEAFTDPKIRKIVMVAASQVGKSELELNIIGYIIDQDPGSILFVQPSLDDARKFSRLRIAPMIRDSKVLRAKVPTSKAKTPETQSSRSHSPAVCSRSQDPTAPPLWLPLPPATFSRRARPLGRVCRC